MTVSAESIRAIEARIADFKERRTDVCGVMRGLHDNLSAARKAHADLGRAIRRMQADVRRLRADGNEGGGDNG